MPFEPRGGKHAIVEVVFGVFFTRNFNATEINALADAHDRWKSDLPRLARKKAINFSLSDGMPIAVGDTMPIGGIAFDAAKRDGSTHWRMLIDGNSIIVNCLEYTKWTEIWSEAIDYIRRSIDIIQSDENPIQAFMLQYIDIFDWHGEREDYSLTELLREDSDFIPASIWPNDVIWHLHQGRFRPVEEPAVGRILERVHIDAMEEKKINYSVKFDTYLKYELKTPVALNVAFEDDQSPGHKVFDCLHTLNKHMLGSYITAEMSERIHLDA